MDGFDEFVSIELEDAVGLRLDEMIFQKLEVYLEDASHPP